MGNMQEPVRNLRILCSLTVPERPWDKVALPENQRCCVHSLILQLMTNADPGLLHQMPIAAAAQMPHTMTYIAPQRGPKPPLARTCDGQ